MEVLYPKCAGLDVHKDSVVACVRLASEQEVVRHLATFGTTTSALLDLGEWLSSYGVTHVAMEATGVYWKPVWHALSGSALPAELTEGEVREDAFHLVLVNAMHIKKVPGRKTDVSDAQWIAELIAHGLVHGSFVPPTPVQERKGPVWLKTMLVQAAWSAIKPKATYLNALFHRVKRKGGAQKAIVAVASSMLRAMYYMLRNGVPYRDLGPQHFTTVDRDKTAKRLLKQLAQLGVEVELKQVA